MSVFASAPNSLITSTLPANVLRIADRRACIIATCCVRLAWGESYQPV